MLYTILCFSIQILYSTHFIKCYNESYHFFEPPHRRTRSRVCPAASRKPHWFLMFLFAFVAPSAMVCFKQQQQQQHQQQQQQQEEEAEQLPLIFYRLRNTKTLTCFKIGDDSKHSFLDPIVVQFRSLLLGRCPNKLVTIYQFIFFSIHQTPWILDLSR